MKRNKKYGYEQHQAQIQSTAYDKQITHDMFKMTMRWLEKYIEIAYGKEFPNWENRKQIHDNIIQRQDIIGNPEIAEETFSTQLFLFESTAKTKSPAILEELKQEFYRWISAVRINSNECPERLKHFLFGINEILEGRGGKIQKDIENRRKLFDSTSPEYMKGMMNLFASTWAPAREEIEVEKTLKGKIDKDIEIGSSFGGGNMDQGQNIFDQISKSVAGSYENFHCVPQKGQHSEGSSGGVLLVILSSDKVDKIPTEIDSFGRAKKQEIMLIRQGARLNDFDPQTGKLNFNNNPIYEWNSFKVQQKFEIKNTLSENRVYLDKDYLADDEISFVIKEFADNPSVWRIEEQSWLVHSSSRERKNEIGTLMHSKEKFSSQEWNEINEVLELNRQYGIVLRKLRGEISFEQQETREGLEIWAKELEKKLLINNIRKNTGKWEFRKEIVELDFNEGEVLARKTAKINKEEDYDLTGGLVNRPNEFYRKDYFDDKEQAEINSILTAYEVIEKINRDKGKDNWMTATVDNKYEIILNKETALMSGEKEFNTNGEYYKREQFTDREWAEIDKVLKKIKLISEIKQHINEFEFQTILTFSGQYWDNINKKWVNYDKEKRESMLVHKQIKLTENDYNEHGYLNIKTDKMFQENRFSQEEWVEIRSALKVDDIKRNAKLEKGLLVINKETGEVSENEHWYITLLKLNVNFLN